MTQDNEAYWNAEHRTDQQTTEEDAKKVVRGVATSTVTIDMPDGFKIGYLETEAVTWDGTTITLWWDPRMIVAMFAAGINVLQKYFPADHMSTDSPDDISALERLPPHGDDDYREPTDDEVFPDPDERHDNG